MLNNTTGWIAGGYANSGYPRRAIILKTTTGGVIPVELTSFTASTKDNEVTLSWSTATETNNSGFEVLRFTQDAKDWKARQYEGVDALCCSAPLIYANRQLAVDIQKKNFEDALACGADAIITSCPICYGVFRRPSAQFNLPSIFITDLCRMALGEKPWPEGSR